LQVRAISAIPIGMDPIHQLVKPSPKIRGKIPFRSEKGDFNNCRLQAIMEARIAACQRVEGLNLIFHVHPSRASWLLLS
jgi:hypothetical protein